VPSFPFSQALTASQVGFNPVSRWQYSRAPWPAVVKILARATTAGVRVSVFAGSDNVVQRAPVQSGGTAGVTPSELNTPAFVFACDYNDPILPLFDEVLAGTPTLDGIISIEPDLSRM